ncbi:GNAT family N-acetyltransferase [Sphingopyxis sp. 113P3]|uniref:GNAT family N-acetyltransferase n=1 Tax=Sphingopyxis sp. (strain 113P3) TaxID=292913 RepID=UPI0006AD4392|nr:GNAT family N-acetyltransferase [Sphingopyxis sp. 113P3]ALC10780.1 GCN5 family acetyltransferase [Sphingopyxis sp. 113P3]
MIAIVRAEASDADALSTFAESSFRHTFGHIYAPDDLATFLADWNPPNRIRAQLADPDWAIALARGKDGAITGFIKLGPIDFDLPEHQPAAGAIELHQLYVSEDAKGTGLAPALIEWGIAWARERAAVLYLSVFSENARAQAFYRRYGFVDVGRNAFRVGNHVDEDRIWKLDL